MTGPDLNRAGICFQSGFFIYLSVLVLTVPLRLLMAVFFCAAVHELCHLGALCVMGVPVRWLRIGVTGVKLHTPAMTDVQELLCALAGPVGGSLLMLLYKQMPVVALCAAGQTLYNLLPLYPSDGGRVLAACARLVLPGGAARRVTAAARAVSLVGICMLGTYGSLVLHLGILPAAVAAVITLRNCSCKARALGVQ